MTVACNEDLGAADLVGRWLIDGGGTRWQDGPLTLAARGGAICYLDELIEARPETTVVIHPLTDTRRVLPIAPLNELLHAHPDFALVVSYNPDVHAQGLKPATLQRFCALRFDHPPTETEVAVVAHESGREPPSSRRASSPWACAPRRLRQHGLEEGASTRMLVRAAALIRRGIAPRAACRMAVVTPLTDDPELQQALSAAVDASF